MLVPIPFKNSQDKLKYCILPDPFLYWLGKGSGFTRLQLAAPV